MGISRIVLNIFIGIIISILFSILLINISPLWQSWEPATCLPDKCFCEAIRESPIKQPSNTWSSYGFVLIGMLMTGFFYGKTYINSKRFSNSYKLIFILSAVLVGLGSAFYHASLTFWGQFVDVFGMYLFVTLFLVYAWQRLFNISETKTIFSYLTLNIVFIFFLLLIPETRRFLFALVLLVALCFEIFVQKRKKIFIQTRWFYYGLGILAIAFLIWILDITKIFCDPYSVWQGHAIWHVLGAVAIFFLYVYFESEETTAILR